MQAVPGNIVPLHQVKEAGEPRNSLSVCSVTVSRVTAMCNGCYVYCTHTCSLQGMISVLIKQLSLNGTVVCEMFSSPLLSPFWCTIYIFFFKELSHFDAIML